MQNLTEYRSDYPKDRPMYYHFALKGTNSGVVLNSDNIQKDIAQKIISYCDTIAIVQFSQLQSSWVNTFGLLDDNKVGPFICIQFDYRNRKPVKRKLLWGEEECI
jgi:hypothetical protein